MERLSTCYFCGAGPQETLRDRPVVPDAVLGDPSAQRTIALCPNCRSKFDRLRETIAEAATDGHQRRLDTPEDSLSILDDEPLEAVALSDSETAAGSVADDGVTGDSADASTPESQSDTPSEAASESMPVSSDDSTTTDPTTAEPDNTEPTPPAPTDDASDSTDGQAASSEPAEPVDDAAPNADERGLTDSTPAGEPSDGASADGGDPSGAVDDPTAGKPFDRKQYSRVVKLLQNREFPVELDALYELARGAYDIDEDTTTEIVGSLMDRGVIEERGGKLFRD